MFSPEGAAMNRLTEFIAGLLFGIGLILAGMTDPGKVIGFLDLAGQWDPSLAFVMGGAIGVGFFAFRMARGRGTTLLGDPMKLPNTEVIDWRLLTGSAVFGVGWGLAGFCPGPAVVVAGAGYWQALLFTLAMLAGMALHELNVRVAPGGVVQE
jgi:uncharacterized membrane protein YedE/YeeE